MTIGERIKARREALGITQVALADSVNEMKQTIYKYENGIITNIPIEKLALIAKRLEVSPAYLMGWEKEIDEYSVNFLRNLDEQMAAVNPQDFTGVEEAEAEYAFLTKISESSRPLTLEEACEAVNLLGSDVSLDEMVGLVQKEKPAPKEGDRLSLEIMNLFLSLPEEKQREALHYLRYLAESEGRK